MSVFFLDYFLIAAVWPLELITSELKVKGGSFQVSLLVDGSSCKETFGLKFYSLVIQREKFIFFSYKGF